MKTILFCNLPYAFSILKPLADELEKLGFPYLWYVPKNIENEFPYKTMPLCTNIKELELFLADAIFVPGNDVPYWLKGVKVQIFHGLAGEKKGHFKIRNYFDLYLTQGPYFTKKFEALSQKHKNFDVIETGWSKLDSLHIIQKETKVYRKMLLSKYEAKYIVLYSPTFSPSLSSAVVLKETIEKLASNKEILCIIKFHDKMDKEVIDAYKKLTTKNIYITLNSDITPYLQMADLMLSDTSSVVYEFTLLDKPVITYRSHSENISWSNHLSKKSLYADIINTLVAKDHYAKKRQETIAQYHPYNDGQSALRMLKATQRYIEVHGVPHKRKLSWYRKFTLRKIHRD